MADSYIYGDPVYVLRPYMQVLFKGSSSQDQKDFNKKMSVVRVSVEHAFKDIKKYFTHVDVPRKLCVKHTPVGLWYFGAAILWNFIALLLRVTKRYHL